MSHTFFVKFKFLKAALHKEYLVCRDKISRENFFVLSVLSIFRVFFLGGGGGGGGGEGVGGARY